MDPYPSGLGGGSPGELVLRLAAVTGYARNVVTRYAEIGEFAVRKATKFVERATIRLPLSEVFHHAHFHYPSLTPDVPDGTFFFPVPLLRSESSGVGFGFRGVIVHSSIALAAMQHN